MLQPCTVVYHIFVIFQETSPAYALLSKPTDKLPISHLTIYNNTSLNIKTQHLSICYTSLSRRIFHFTDHLQINYYLDPYSIYKTPTDTDMFLWSAIFDCFMLNSSSRVFHDEKLLSKAKLASSDKTKGKSKSSKPSSPAPTVVHHFPVNAMLSRL